MSYLKRILEYTTNIMSALLNMPHYYNVKHRKLAMQNILVFSKITQNI